MKGSKGSGGGSNVDWNELNRHIHEQVGEATQSRLYQLTGLVDLGTQPRDNFEEEYEPNNEKKGHDKLIEDGKATLIVGKSKKGEPVDMISKPLSPARSVAFVLDFPEIMINYGKFFGKDGKDDFKPLRVYYGGEFFNRNKGYATLARPTSVLTMPNDKAPSGWSFATNSIITKFGKVAGLDTQGVLDGEVELGDMIGSIGMMSVSSKLTEKGDKVYQNTYAKDPAPKHPAIPVPNKESLPQTFGISFFNPEDEDGNKVPNDPEMLKQLKKACKDTMKEATDWDISDVKKELEALESGSDSKPKQTPKDKPKTPSSASQGTSDVSSTPSDEFEEDLPWDAEENTSEEETQEDPALDEAFDDEDDPFA